MAKRVIMATVEKATAVVATGEWRMAAWDVMGVLVTLGWPKIARDIMATGAQGMAR
jgi:hypothetical protein